MDWGSPTGGVLAGGPADDVYLIGPNQAPGVIADTGGSDTIALYLSTQFTQFDDAWLIKDGDDLLVRIPDGNGGWLVDFRIQGMGGSSAVERLEIYSGANYRLTDSIDLIERWTSLGGERNSFQDDFNRADGPVGNGWLGATDNPLSDLVIRSGVVTAAGIHDGAAMYRPIDLNSTDTVSFTVTQHSGYGGLAHRFEYVLRFGSDGSSGSGYGISINRGDQNYSDSRVQVVHDGTIVGAIMSPFQFQNELTASITLLADGTLRGTITEGANVFNFDFGPHAVTLTDNYVSIAVESPDGPPYIYATLDNLTFSASLPEIHAVGTASDESFSGGGAADGLSGAAGADTLTGGGGGDSLFGGGGDDALLGQAGNDCLFGGVGADSLDGGDGDDVLTDGGSEADLLTGGSGEDTVRYVEAAAAVIVGLGLSGPQFTHGAGTDTLSGIEDLVGSAFDDTLTGDGQANTINGWTGLDYIYGQAGDDTLIGLDGNDKLYGGSGVDRLFGGDGADTLNGDTEVDQLDGGAGNDVLDGGTGADSLSGGAGDDIYYVDDAGDITIEASGQGADVVRTTVSFTLAANIETMVLDGSASINGTGNALVNPITGNGGDNILDGDAGDDVLKGMGGDDTLIGGTGSDIMVGGAGADTFVLRQESVIQSHLGGAIEVDTVNDLIAAQGDKIDLSAIDADCNTAGDQAFHLVGNFSHSAGEMTLSYSGGVTLLSIDVDGDGSADYRMKISGDVRLDSGGWLL